MRGAIERLLPGVLLVLVSEGAWALDSYRYLRVTIDTPWMIFLVLAVVVLLPFIILMVLYWYYAAKKPSPEEAGETGAAEPPERKDHV